MARATWTVSGTLTVGDVPGDFQLNNSDTQPLAGVSVKIYANEGVRWNLWGSATTNANGNFSLTKTKDRTRRKFRIKAQFKNKDMVIYGSNPSVLSALLPKFDRLNVMTPENVGLLEGILDHTSRLTYKSDWYTIHETEGERRDQTRRNYSVDITMRMNTHGRTAFRHAFMWYGLETLRRHLEEKGLPFKKKIAVKYPHDNLLISNKLEQAYCSPINNCVYLCDNGRIDNMETGTRNDLTLETLYHEAMHLWAYGYSRGEDGMAWQLLIHGSTHDGIQNKTFVAFHEAFAEVAARTLLKNIFNHRGFIYDHPDRPFRNQPFNRRFLRSMGINVLSDIDHHEFGWMHIFNTLMCKNLRQFDLNRESTRTGMSIYADRRFSDSDRVYSLTIYDIMEAFNHPAPYKTKDMRFENFLERVRRSVDEFDANSVNAFRIFFNVNHMGLPRVELTNPPLETEPRTIEGKKGVTQRRLSRR